jgi:hypothetical protein
MIFVLFWVTQLFIAMTEFIVGSVIVLWYITDGGRLGNGGHLSKSVWRLFRYHFGAVATGTVRFPL